MADVIARTRPDIMLLQGVDYDLELRALAALRDVLAEAGPDYPHLFALRPNTGWQTGHDIDGDGRLGEPEDARGFGRFAGQAGMAILSRWPIDTDGVQDFTEMLWRDLPRATLPVQDGAPFPSAEAQAEWRLAAVAHWAVPVRAPGGPLHLLALHASAPVFDGPEDRNGLRNRDQLRFWSLYLDGTFGPAPEARFALLGVTNQDPEDGEGRKDGIIALLRDRRFTDPLPRREGPATPEPGHRTDPTLDTVAWPQPDPGHLRVSYILPSMDWRVTGAGVHWPREGTAAGDAARAASRHRLIWVDLQGGG